MTTDCVQGLRYKLQKRYRKVRAAPRQLMAIVLKQFWRFTQTQPVLVGIMEDLARRCPEAEASASEVLYKRRGVYEEDENSHAAIAYLVVKKCAESENTENLIDVVGISYGGQGFEDRTERFRAMALEPFYEYLDEQLDDQRLLLSLLVRYKHKCEWFRSEELLQMASADTSRAERSLAQHMYEYLYDQGLEFSIEPRSASGKPDLVSAQTGDHRLVADAKVYAEKSTKSYLVRGFNQIYTYARDYNEPFGYLVIYNISGQDLKFVLGEQEQSVPFHCHNGKTIFILTIDISPYTETASKRGPLKSLEITAQDLVQLVQAETTREGEAS